MTPSHPAFLDVLRLLGERTGLSFGPNRLESGEAGIRRAMARLGVSDPERYAGLLREDASLLEGLVTELTVGETYFFREHGQFEFIRSTILPDVHQRRGPEHCLRVWSAGCASGEEAYSVAMLLEDAGLSERAHILATDISRVALARATQAVFGEWSLRGEGANRARAHLQRDGKRYRLPDRLRRRVTFEHLNLALDVYPSFLTRTWGMDLILCRNVLIYFDRTTVSAVARRLWESLVPGGWLLTASSDPPLANEGPFEAVLTDVGVVYRRPPDRAAEERVPRVEPAIASLPVLSLGSPVHAPEVVRQAPGETRPGAAAIDAASDPLVQASEALARGDYRRAASLTRTLMDDATAALVRVRALANLEPGGAEPVCRDACQRHPLNVELRHLHSLLLLELGRLGEATSAARHVIYLDRTLAIGHFTLGTMLARQGDRAAAVRAYRNARDLCAVRPPEETLPLGEGDCAGRLAEAATVQLTLLGEEGAP